MRVRPRMLLGLLLIVAAVACSLDVSAQAPYRRRDISTAFTPAEQLELRTLMMQWITTSAFNPIQQHLNVIGPLPIGVHCNTETFASWHRWYIARLEAWLMSQPNGSKYVPLPKWTPTTGIPGAFFNNLVFPGSAVAPSYPLLADQTPNDQGVYNFTRFLNPNTICNYFAGVQQRACMSGGVSNTFGTATDNFARDLEREHNPVHGAIGGVMNSGASPAAAIFWLWHGYVDDLYQYYLCNCTSTQRAVDLMIMDNYGDIGDEPNTSTAIYNASPEIWVRNTADPIVGGRYANEDNPTRHQAPVFQATPNYVYVRVRNKGCSRNLAGSHNLRVYWSVASSGLNWANDWTVYPIGSEITTVPVLIPALDPGQTYTAQIPWMVPPQDIATRFCLLARLESAVDPMTTPEGLNVNTNTRNNNNIAMRNVIIIPEDPITPPNGGGGGGTYCSYVRPVYPYGGYTRLEFEYPDYSQEYIQPTVYLGPELYEYWENGGYNSYGVEPVPGEYAIRITQPDAYIDRLQLEYDPTGGTYGYNVCVDVETYYDPYGGYPPVYYGDETYVAITQYEQNEDGVYEPTGGEYYEVRYEQDEYSGCGSYINDPYVQPSSCPDAHSGLYDGAIKLTLNGQEPYTYYWSNGSSQRDQYGLAPGSYTVMVRDGRGCTDSRTINVPYSSTLQTYVTGGAPSCSNNNGYANVTVTGGQPPYSYQWYKDEVPIPGAIHPSIIGLGYGSYSVASRDRSGCTIIGYITYVDDWMELTPTYQITPASSPTTPNGAINISVNNGMPPYTYAWSNGSTTEDINNLLPGEYSVEVRDMMGCVVNATVTVGISPPTKNVLPPDGSQGDLSIQAIVPNPVKDLAEVQYTLLSASNVRVEIYDELGKVVYSYDQGQKPVGQNSAWLPVNELPPGRYSCHLVFRGGISAVPFLIVR